MKFNILAIESLAQISCSTFASPGTWDLGQVNDCRAQLRGCNDVKILKMLPERQQNKYIN